MRFALDPTVAEDSPPIPPAPRLGDLASKRLGFVDNSKLNADLFLSRIAAELAGRFGVVVGPVIRKFVPKDYLSEANIAELAECDAVVQCFGDCGTSTSVSVADAVELERRGIPTVTVFSTAFAQAARNQAEGRGMRALHLVTVPHPMHTAPRAVVAERADKAVESIVGRLTREFVEETNGVATPAAMTAVDDDQELFLRARQNRRAPSRHADG